MKKNQKNQKSKIATGYLVPENYFIDFSNRILSQLPDEESNIVSFHSNRFKIAVAIAAAILVIMMIPIYNQFTSTTLELDATTIEHHLTYQSDMDCYELVSELDESDFNQLQSTFQVSNETIETILATNPRLESLITDY